MTESLRSRKRARSTFVAVMFAALLALAGVPSAEAGGFQISVQAPDAAKMSMKDAVLVVRTFGCMQPADANVTITAEGIVAGRRQTVPVELHADQTGVYAIRQQWPAEGKWVLVLTGTLHGMTSTVFVELGDKGRVHADTRLDAGELSGKHARGLRRTPTSGDVEAALKANIGSIAKSDAPLYVPPGAIAAGGAGAFLFLVGIAALKRRRS
ncbi:MAG TPA: hypothetical protein VJZ91_08140 [Blastocatellia bacterium]|nr:hypothetical protein [Blastocatellia bacterium]